MHTVCTLVLGGSARKSRQSIAQIVKENVGDPDAKLCHVYLYTQHYNEEPSHQL